MHRKSIFIFHKDLRLEDNTGLIAALMSSKKVVPLFIFDERQLLNNDYFSENAFEFMIESLFDLDQQLKSRGSYLNMIKKGKTVDVLRELIEKENIDAIYSNRDYTPFAKNRDLEIAELSLEKDISYYQFADSLFYEPEELLKDDGTFYKVFTPFFKRALTFQPKLIRRNNYHNFTNISSDNIGLADSLLKKRNTHLAVRGGRKNALNILKNNFSDYFDFRNYPSQKKTTMLSAYVKFGCVSPREIHDRFFSNHELLREFFWRDFLIHLAFHCPYVFGKEFKIKFQSMKWDYDMERFLAWCNGVTGFPIVDAGMRQLNQTGFMHNRVRMIVASFLVKNLHIDWRWGEKYFAKKLVDYDPAVNNGNWQWAASTGADAVPYFRIFSPLSQQERFDKDFDYVSEWISELRGFDNKTLYGLYKKPQALGKYPAMIIDAKREAEICKTIYKSY